jgi:hypothetical protein
MGLCPDITIHRIPAALHMDCQLAARGTCRGTREYTGADTVSCPASIQPRPHTATVQLHISAMHCGIRLHGQLGPTWHCPWALAPSTTPPQQSDAHNHCCRFPVATAPGTEPLCIPRYALPNTTSVLPLYGNSDGEQIFRTFHTGNYDMLRLLPNSLKEVCPGLAACSC